MKSKLLMFTVVALFLAIGFLLVPLAASKLKQGPASMPNAASAHRTTEPVQPAPIEKVSVDFENTQLSEVVQFITAKTHVKFVFDGLGSSPITWQEFDLPLPSLVSSFERVLKLAGINCKHTDGHILLSKATVLNELERLDFAISDNGSFFLYRGHIYEASKLPCSLRRINGQWYAIAAGSSSGNQGDQLPAFAGFGRPELAVQ